MQDYDVALKLRGREIRKAQQEGGVSILRRLIDERFGTMPSWAVERLAMRNVARARRP